MTYTKTLLIGGLAAALATGVPLMAQTGGAVMLGQLTKGEWTIRFRDGLPERKICVRSGHELVQLKHKARNCSRFVVEDGANEVTVQYTCLGDGYGRTSIRRETSSLVQIESQGIAGDLPFQMIAEARRTGACR